MYSPSRYELTRAMQELSFGLTTLFRVEMENVSSFEAVASHRGMVNYLRQYWSMSCSCNLQLDRLEFTRVTWMGHF